MKGSGGMGNIEACREKARPAVVACVKSALNAANGRANVAVAIPTEAAPKASAAGAMPAGFVAPPRTITDITAILDSEKPDLKTIEELQGEANSNPTGKESREDLAQFYFDRGNARAQLGRLADAIADANKAIETGRGAVSANMMGRLISLAAHQYSAAGDPKKAFELHQRQLREISTQRGAKGYQFGSNRAIAGILIQMGDIAQAEAVLRRSLPQLQESRTSGHPAVRAAYNTYGQSWEGEIELGRAMLAEARGQFRDAEAAYETRRTAQACGDQADYWKRTIRLPKSSMVLAVDFAVVSQARVKARQGRFGEAEVDARRALLSQLKNQGKYNAATPRFIAGLADILVEQGRYAEAEQLARVSLEISRTVGVAGDAVTYVQQLSHLGSILNLQRKGREAIEVYAQIDKAIANWEPGRRQAFELNGGRIASLYASGQIEAGIAAAEQLVKNQVARVGENHFGTASARGTLAIGLMRAGRDQDAIREFRAAIPVLMASSRENADDDDTTAIAARSQRLQGIVEAYLTMLARDKNASGDVGVETFSLADAIRGRSVQQALAASSARATAKDPALAELVRKEQDLGKQVNAQLGTLTNVLSLPSQRARREGRPGDQRLDQFAARRTAQGAAGNQPAIPRLCRSGLAEAALGRADQGDACRRRGDAVVLFRANQQLRLGGAEERSGGVCRDQGLQRRHREQGAQTARSAGAAGGDDLGHSAVRSQAGARTLFAAAAAGRERMEAGEEPDRGHQRRARSAAAVAAADRASRNRSDDDPLFASYRNVPWLARTHAVTTVPSAAALRTLRQLPAGKPSTRRADRVRRSLFQQGAGSRGRQRRQGARGGRRRQHHARRSAEAAQQPEARRRGQRGTRACCRGFPIRRTS